MLSTLPKIPEILAGSQMERSVLVLPTGIFGITSVSGLLILTEIFHFIFTSRFIALLLFN